MANLSISSKIRLAVVVPLMFQLVFLAALVYLQRELEGQLRVSVKAKIVSDGINEVARDYYEIFLQFMEFSAPHVMLQPMQNRRMFAIKLADTRMHMNRLKALINDDPHLTIMIEKSEQSLDRAIRIMSQLGQLQSSADPRALAYGPQLWKQLEVEFETMLYGQNGPGLLRVAQDQRQVYQTTYDKQSTLRNRFQDMAVLIEVINVFLATAVAVYITKSISEKLKLLNDNSFRLASNLPLNPPLRGGDEIAKLDATFHTMANTLRQAARKERAIMDTARDVMCSVDGSCKITSINPSCEQMLGIKPADMIGTHLGEFLSCGREQALALIGQLKQGKEVGGDLELKRSDGEPVYALLSAHWSDEENSAFLVIHDITDRRQAELLRKELVAMITHDLRTPLTNFGHVITFLSTGRYGELNEKGKEYLNLGTLNVHRMSTLVSDMLDIEKIDSGSMQLEGEKVILDRCFEDCLASLSPLADAGGVKLTFADAPRIAVWGDEQKIGRVLVNLIGNAIKFSPRASEIKVTAALQEDHFARIAVCDQGKGIPKDELESVFKRFHQVAGTKQTGPSSGLGLTICRAFVELHGGKIWVESELGVGSSFIFTLPLATAP
jgi:PAS domain S-box-containing protein